VPGPGEAVTGEFEFPEKKRVLATAQCQIGMKPDAGGGQAAGRYQGVAGGGRGIGLQIGQAALLAGLVEKPGLLNPLRRVGLACRARIPVLRDR